MSYLFLKLLACEPFSLSKSPQNSAPMSLSLNCLATLWSALLSETHDPKRERVQLAFQRGLIYSRQGRHEAAHEEFHQVIENRDNLEPRIARSNYFQFMIRELKQAEFLKCNRTESSQEEAKTDDAAFFTGFKGLFRKVIG